MIHRSCSIPGCYYYLSLQLCDSAMAAKLARSHCPACRREAFSRPLVQPSAPSGGSPGQEFVMTQELKGICAAACTPMSEDGSRVDYDRLKTHLDTLIEAGVHIIAVCGGTGEFPFLSTEEKRRIAEVAARHVDGRAKFIVQSSAIRTEDAIEIGRASCRERG